MQLQWEQGQGTLMSALSDNCGYSKLETTAPKVTYRALMASCWQGRTCACRWTTI